MDVLEGVPLVLFGQQLIFDLNPWKVNKQRSLPVKADVFPDVFDGTENEVKSSIHTFGLQFSCVCVRWIRGGFCRGKSEVKGCVFKFQFKDVMIKREDHLRHCFGVTI